jgi:hypothetical protein
VVAFVMFVVFIVFVAAIQTAAILGAHDVRDRHQP